MENAAFEVKSGKLLIADPYSLGYTAEEAEELLSGADNRNLIFRQIPKSHPNGVLFSTDGEEVGLYVFRNEDRIAITREAHSYADNEAGKMGLYLNVATIPSIDIPIGDLIGSEKFIFNPRKLLEQKGALENMMNVSPFVCTANAEVCEILIADAQNYARPREQWKARFPENDRRFFGCDLSQESVNEIKDTYNGVLNVSPGVYECSYFPEWMTAVVKKR